MHFDSAWNCWQSAINPIYVISFIRLALHQDMDYKTDNIGPLCPKQFTIWQIGEYPVYIVVDDRLYKQKTGVLLPGRIPVI